ncbi:MAG: S8 family serine peptidase [Actinomycetota bacterium]|nr:S8 family serine peptidase [Actinomycetota bacterium]
MRGWLIVALLVVALPAVGVPSRSDATTRQAAVEDSYVVLYGAEAPLDAAREAVRQAGGTIVDEQPAVGVATVRAADAGFAADVARHPAVVGSAADVSIGRVPAAEADKRDEVEELGAGLMGDAGAQRRAVRRPGDEPLAGRQWDMRMLHATPRESYRVQPGSPDVTVGIIDTGVDGSHPDITPNFNGALSRNFTTDIPHVDGSCAEEPDRSCSDPADVDEAGHGTHVAGTIAAARNDLGIAGVAPEVTLVNLRAGQDSGFFFLQETVDALVYAAEHGVDVVNMSFYVDPWLFNCRDHPADSPRQRQEQRIIVAATQRALDYAHDKGVALVAALGNEDTDLGQPRIDDLSPDFPPDRARRRRVDDSCLTMPTEGEHVVGVTAVGPSTRKAYYSNYGIEEADVAAPGGDLSDFPGSSRFGSPGNLILSTYPETVLRKEGLLRRDGRPVEQAATFVLRDCRGERCGYYVYLQGTSMAAPHAAGVAALVVSRHGGPDGGRPGLAPGLTRRALLSSATDTPCPAPRTMDYPGLGRRYTARCQGTRRRNGFYGDGVVNAYRAVTDPFALR